MALELSFEEVRDCSSLDVGCEMGAVPSDVVVGAVLRQSEGAMSLSSSIQFSVAWSLDELHEPPLPAFLSLQLPAHCSYISIPL